MRWQKKLHAAPFKACEVEKSHGRETIRKLALSSISATASGMPYGITLIKVVSHQDKHSAEETRYYLSSAPAESLTPQRWLARIRGHWKCESQHWRKDATLGEDRTRTRNPNIMSNTIMLRNLVLHYYHAHGESQAQWLPIWVEQNQANIDSAFTLVTKNRA